MTLISLSLPLQSGAAVALDQLRLCRHLLAQAVQRWRIQRDAHVTRRALAQLDDRTLHDLGFHRSEIGSVAAELGGSARAERQRVLLSTSHRVA
jgi:uncharacterized protein YjiS (DUF1127 family)